MSTLATIGCSFVWGDELVGFQENPPSHFQNTFGSILARKLGMEHENLAMCGNGNAKIFRDLMLYLSDNQPDALVIVWSAWKRIELFESKYKNAERDMKIQREQNMSQFSPVRYQYLNKENMDVAGMWGTLVNNNQTGIIQTLSYMSAIQQLCDARGIKIVQSVFHTAMSNQLLDAFYRTNDKNDTMEWRRYVHDRIKNHLRPECTLGIRFIDIMEKTFSNPKLHRRNVGIPDGRTKIHTGEAVRDDNDHWTMYELGMENKDIAEFGHPKELTHRLYAESLEKIFKKL